MNDNDLIADKCFMWLSKWKACPVEVINYIQSIYLQTVPTLTFKKFRGQSEISSTACRLCDSNSQESVWQIHYIHIHQTSQPSCSIHIVSCVTHV